MNVIATKLPRDGALISMQESEGTVLKLCRQEKATIPPRDAVHFLAKELVRLALEARAPGLTSGATRDGDAETIGGVPAARS